MVNMPAERPRTEAAHDILRHRGANLDIFFHPQTVAVIGASERVGSVGRTLLWNLISSPFGGTVFPVNPKRRSLLGITAYPSVSDLPVPIDLAIIATPAETVPAVVEQCAAAGVKGAIIISAGFREVGPAGQALEEAVSRAAERGGLRVIGPNCLGVMSPCTGLNATFARSMAHLGTVGFISQSGALCTAILDWSLRQHVGFSAFISIGAMVDVGWGDLIDYLGDDPRTESILLYMESIGDADAFLSAARAVALTKPIIVIKAGRTAAAARAAASHTGALAGSDAALDAAFERCGILRVDSIAELFDMAEVLAKQPRPRGPRLTIVTNAGGPGVLATDALIANGGELASLPAETVAALDQVLPAHWSHANPIDILGDATPDRYAAAVDIAASNAASDGLLIVLTPQEMTDPTRTAECLTARPPDAGKPVLASWMGATTIATGDEILNRHGIPTFAYPDAAVRAFLLMWRYNENLRTLYETPALPPDLADQPDRAAATGLLQQVQFDQRTLLTETESKQLLAAYGLPTIPSIVARTPAEAVTAAASIGYPVVLKLHSTTITHKSDVGGVHLDLTGAAQVKEAFGAIEGTVAERAGQQHFQGVTVQPMIKGGYELIVGSAIDDQLGPVVLVGSGGRLVEVYQDRALALPPLTTTLARRLVEKTRIMTALKGVRGEPPADLAALETLLVRFSQLIVEQPWIKEIDINPLTVFPGNSGPAELPMVILDARVLLHDGTTDPARLPRSAIRPYPAQYVTEWQFPDGSPAKIRPIRPEDEPLMVRFHESLSATSVYLRYFHILSLSRRVAHERLIRICHTDYNREIPLVVERHDPATGQPAIVAVGRLSRLRDAAAAEFALIVADAFQRQGLGTELLRRLIEVGRAEGLESIQALLLTENTAMRAICQRLGFQLSLQPADGIITAQLTLARH